MTALIVGVGASGALGANALHIATARRAAALAPRATSFRDARGRRHGAWMQGSIDQGIEGVDRAVVLARRALREALWGLDVPPGSLPFYLAIPASRPGFSIDDGDQLASEIREPRLDRERGVVIRGSNTSFAMVLASALEDLEARRVDRAVVGAADSWISSDAFEALEEECAIGDDGDEMMPGEGSAFLLLERGAAAGPYGAIEGVALGCEPEESLATAVVATRLCRQMATPAPELCAFLVDASAERFRRRSWGYVRNRLGLDRAASVDISSLPLEMGDLGAATGAIMAAIVAIDGASRGRPRTICVTSDAGAERAVFAWGTGRRDARG